MTSERNKVALLTATESPAKGSGLEFKSPLSLAAKTFEGGASKGPSLAGLSRNSLESINSRFSTSSTLDEPISAGQLSASRAELERLDGEPVTLDAHLLPQCHNSNSSSAQHGQYVLDLSSCSRDAQPNFKPTNLDTQVDLRKLTNPTLALGTHHDPDDFASFDESPSRRPTGGEGDATRESVHVNKRREDEPPFMFAGIVASILGSVTSSIGFMCAKLLPDSTFRGSVTTLLIRGLIIILLSGGSSLCRGSRLTIKRDEIWVNASRAVFGSLGVLGTYCAMQYISVGDTTALVFSSPIWTSLLSRLILKEPLRWIQLMALPSSLLGIVLIAHPALIVDVNRLPAGTRHTTSGAPLFADARSNNLTSAVAHQYQPLISYADSQRWPGVVIALGTSLMVSCTYIVLKFRKSTPIQTTTFWLGVTMVFVSANLLALVVEQHRIPSDPYELFLYGVIGFSSWSSQTVFQWAFQYETAGVLSVVRTLDVAMTFILSAIFIADDIYWTSVLGATIISASVASIMINNWLRGQSNHQREAPPPQTTPEVSAPSAKNDETNRSKIYHLFVPAPQSEKQ